MMVRFIIAATKMKTFLDTLLTIAVLGGILILSAVITNLFTHKMYYKCSECGALNAKRRSQCRICGNSLTESSGPSSVKGKS